MDTRVSDRGRWAARWGRWGRDVTTIVAVGLAAYAVFITQSHVNDIDRQADRTEKLAAQNTATLAQLKVEQKQRINETCRIQETKQKSDVEALAQTYAYLGSLDAQQLAEPLNKAVLAGLPRTIREAQQDDAPASCDKPGAAAESRGAPPVGLPEPDTPLPKPPANLKQFLKSLK